MGVLRTSGIRYHHAVSDGVSEPSLVLCSALLCVRGGELGPGLLALARAL